HLHLARGEAGYRPIALLETLGSLLRNGVTLIAMLIVLAGFGVWLPVALLASTLPVLGVVLRDAVRQHEFRDVRNAPGAARLVSRLAAHCRRCRRRSPALCARRLFEGRLSRPAEATPPRTFRFGTPSGRR